MTNCVTVLHCADLHLTAWEDKAYAADAFLTFRRILALAKRQKASLLLIAGDLFDAVSAPQSLITAVQNELAGCDAEIIICGGNHDPIALGAPLARPGYSENVHILPPGKVTSLDFPALGVRVYGGSFGLSHEPNALLANCHALPCDRFQIGLFHGDVTENGGDYAPITQGMIAACGLDYLALGHQHTAKQIKNPSKTAVYYPGTPQPRRFSESGGVNILRIQNGSCQVTHQTVAAREYHSFSVEISECENDTAVLQAILSAARARCDCQKSACRITLCGQVTGYRPDVPFLRGQLREEFALLQLSDETVTLPDGKDEADYSLQQMFYKQMQLRMAQATDQKQRETIALAIRYGLKAFYGEIDG